MRQLLVPSLVLATVALSALAARERSAGRGLRKALLWVGAALTLYWWGVQELIEPPG